MSASSPCDSPIVPALLNIAGGGLQASINPAGAELMSLAYNGQPLLWPGNPTSWAERAPVLFPTIGLVANGEIRVDGKSYPMPPHGFAKRSLFTVASRSASHCSLVLEANAETAVHYPFPFKLTITYRVEAASLRVAATIANSGTTLLPASFGFHPGFRWPLEPGLAKTDYRLTLADDPHILTLRPIQGFFGPETTAIDLPGGELALSDEMFTAGGLFLVAPKSRSFRYGATGGTLALVFEPENCPDLMLWMKPGAEFLCIEPWHGTPDPVGFSGDFRDKPDLALVAPGESVDIALTIRVAA